MRSALFLVAATAAALATRDDDKRDQIVLIENQDSPPADANAVQAWWDAFPNPGNLLSSVEERITKSIRGSKLDNFLSLADSDDEDEGEEGNPHLPHGGHGDGHRHEDKTIYELIKDSQHASKFAKLVEEHDEIKQLLDDKEHNYTLFVPTDRALDRIHGGRKHRHEKPSKEFILAFLKYHIVPGLYPAHRIQTSRTLPSELHPAALDGASTRRHKHKHNHHPQRIRSFTVPIVHLTRLNFRTRLVGPEFHAKNGILRAVDSPLIPPPSQTTIVRLLPGQFSTLALALETTGLGGELDGLERRGGGTLFTPTNRAWAALGPRLNAFLFSEPGREYLRALLRYHVVVNETLYSDAYYRGGGEHHGDDGDDDDDGEDGEDGDAARVGDAGRGYLHVDLPSLLHGAPISVDIRTWKEFVSIVVNGFTRVDVRDVVADDGVVQVVRQVLIPPHKHHGARGDVGDENEGKREMSVEELKARLEPYLETPETTGGRDNMGDL
ncbi:Fasciclin domain-containing protein [Thermothelomyces heterothallicus CBS 202.75]|uniref:Fasciclin domain-containing protein n=1 Tax=Thermothelomyces heterothallicus CBS 202.75 TaxID=1149848 RepID=UPI0037442EEB